MIKIDGELFWNIYDFWEVESTQTGAHSDHNSRAHRAAPGMPRYLVPSSNVGSGPSSGTRKIIYGKKCVKISAQSELGISENLRNREGPDVGNAKQKRT